MKTILERTSVFIIGSGTLGKLLVEIIESTNEFMVGGFYDDNYPRVSFVLGYPVIGKTVDIPNVETLSLAIGVGEPKYRKEIFNRESEKGHIFPSIIHPSVYISKYSTVGEGIIIGPNSSVLGGTHIHRGVCILSHVNINQDVIIEPYCLLGAGVIIGNNARLSEGCHIGMGKTIKLEEVVGDWTFYK